jgi:hypothetical protein
MSQETHASVFNLMACVAAFLFVALVAMFGHPASRPGRAATMAANVAAGAQGVSAPASAGRATAEYRATK